MENVKMNIFNIVGHGTCVLPEDGDKVYLSIEQAFLENKEVILSFKNVNKVTSAFLNNAIGRLYDQFDEEFIKNNLSIEDISNSSTMILKRVIKIAKGYYENPQKIKDSLKETFGNLNE
ncbi:STAS-like domain-containing protein [Aliarcobacter butzleri]|uniref:STAS-like domain-containing protein n=1 Tax=Aliarcobacter butzleri TaxID=28197 RepID=UPI003AFA6504